MTNYFAEMEEQYYANLASRAKVLKQEPQLDLYYVVTYDNKTILMWGESEEYVRDIMGKFGHDVIYDIGIATKRAGYFWIVDITTNVEHNK